MESDVTDAYFRNRPMRDNMVVNRRIERGRCWLVFGIGLEIEVPEKIFWLTNLGDEWPAVQVAKWASDAVAS